MDIKSKINPILALRALQALLAVITLGLFGHVAAWYNSNSISPSGDEVSPAPAPNEIIYAIFVTVLTLLITLPYTLLTPRYFPALAHRYTILLLELLSMTLWFASWVAVAAFLGHLSVCRGHVCGAAKVGVGLAAVEWMSWVVTSVFAVRFCLARKSTDDTGMVVAERGVKKEAGEEEEEKKWVGKLRGWGVGSIVGSSGVSALEQEREREQQRYEREKRHNLDGGKF